MTVAARINGKATLTTIFTKYWTKLPLMNSFDENLGKVFSFVQLRKDEPLISFIKRIVVIGSYTTN